MLRVLLRMLTAPAVCSCKGHYRNPERGPFFHCHRCGEFIDPRSEKVR